MALIWGTLVILVFANFVEFVEPVDSPQMQLDDGYRSNSIKNGQDVAYKCAPGYTQTGGSPVCRMVKCPAIFVANGRVSPKAVVFNTVVQITCAPGFKLNGGRKLRCGADGSWMPNVPTCEPVTCPDIYVANGQVDPQAVVFNTVVQITCSPGFNLNGAEKLRCGADGSWTSNVPTCEPATKENVNDVTCPAIFVANGQVDPQEVVFDTLVQITCSPGFNLNGVQQLRCGADGSWTPNVPTCEPVTCPAIFVADGQADPQEVVFDTLVQITCSPGFNLNGVQQLRCGADGSWTPNVPTCEPVTCPAIYVADGQVSSQVVVFDTVVQITCSPGFNLNGAQQLRCGADGSWTPNVPICEPVLQSPETVTCSAPVVENGMIKGGAKPWYEPNDTVIIICKAGCRMIGASKAKCGPDGQWQGLPRCRIAAKFP